MKKIFTLVFICLLPFIASAHMPGNGNKINIVSLIATGIASMITFYLLQKKTKINKFWLILVSTVATAIYFVLFFVLFFFLYW